MAKIIQSINDDRLYKELNLKNNLQVLLISDKQTEKSAASLSVGVGHLEDPIHRQGLAHFLEHMLFLSTEKYPVVDDYRNFLQKNFGSSNAYTDSMETNYYFDVANEKFVEALDRFSQFFISPTLDQKYIDKEINAVNSEHEKNILQDVWREMQIFRESAKEGNVMKKFGTGNLQTLQCSNIREELVQFYKSKYSANKMKLCVYSQENLENLQSLIEEKFSPIKNNDQIKTQFTDIPYDSSNLKNLYKIVPVKDKDQLDFIWILDYMNIHYKNNPVNYISHILGHEGQNSLTSFLIDEGLIYELSSGYQDQMNLFTKFYIKMRLTKKGLENYHKVCECVFNYIKILKEKGVQKYIFDEIKQINKIQFDYKNKEKPSNYVVSNSTKMHEYPIEDVLVLNYLMEDFKPDLLQQVIDQFKLENLRIQLISKSLEDQTNEVEKIYGIKYKVEPISENLIRLFNQQNLGQFKTLKKLDIPVVNDFIPKNLNLFPIQQNSPLYPQKIHIDSQQSELFFKQDNKFKVPKSYIRCKIHVNNIGFTYDPVTDLCVNIWLDMFNNHINEINYLAQMASLSASFDILPNGILFSVQGFNDSMPKLINSLFQSLSQFDPTQYHDKFEYFYNLYDQKYQNYFKSPPYQLIFHYKECFLKDNSCFMISQLQDALKILNFDKFQFLIKQWLKNIRFEWLITGNMSEIQAIDIVKNTEKNLSKIFSGSTQILNKEDTIQIRPLEYQKGLTLFFQEKNHLNIQNNSAIIINFQCQGKKDSESIFTKLLVEAISSDYFKILRTEEQLGYVVWAINDDTRGIWSIQFIIQSDCKSPQYLQDRIHNFINLYKCKLENMDETEFEQYKDSLILKLTEKDINLYKESGKYWYEITRHTNQFDRRFREAEKVRQIKKQDLLNFYDELFYSEKRELQIHLISHNHIQENHDLKEKFMKQDQNFKLVKSLNQLKNKSSLLPDKYSYSYTTDDQK